MGTKLDAVRERIAKLLNFTTERGASEAEAQTALALAQRMMREHSIGEAEVHALGDHDPEIDDEPMAWCEEYDITAKSTATTWIGILGYRIGFNMGCASKWSRGLGGIKLLKFYGRRSDCEAASYMLRLAMAEVERLTKAWVSQDRSTRGRQARGYRTGCASGIARVLRQEYVNARSQCVGNTSALAVIDRGALAQRESGVGVGKTRATGGVGYLSGLRDGKGVSLNQARGTIGGGALRLGSGKR